MVHEGITGDALRAGRELAGLTVRGLGHLAGVSPSAIHRLEKYGDGSVSCIRPVLHSVTAVLLLNGVELVDGRARKVAKEAA